MAADANKGELVVTDDLSGFYHYDAAVQWFIGKKGGETLEPMLQGTKLDGRSTQTLSQTM